MNKKFDFPGREEHTARMARARVPLKPPVIIPAKNQREYLKRAASDENGCATSSGVAFQQKNRAAVEEISKRRQVSQSTKMGLSKSKLYSDLKNSKLPPYASGGRPLISDSEKGKSKVIRCLGYTDIDSDFANPQMCSLYAPVMYSHLFAAELVRRPSSDFMETLQRDMPQKTRGMIIDWLVQISEECKLAVNTLYLAVYMIDMFLSQICVDERRLQLLGLTSILIASKYEEINAPSVKDFCLVAHNTYNIKEVLEMESEVLKHLDFHLSDPTVKTFLRRFKRAAHPSGKDTMLQPFGYLANYLAELTLVEYSFLKFLPSKIAASAVFLARWILDQSRNPWNTTLQHYTSYKALDLKEPAMALQNLHINSKSKTGKLRAIPRKYKKKEFMAVSTLPSPKLLPWLFQ